MYTKNTLKCKTRLKQFYTKLNNSQFLNEIDSTDKFLSLNEN